MSNQSHVTAFELISQTHLQRIVANALEEDIGTGDITSASTIDSTVLATAAIVVKTSGVVAGLPVATEVFRQVDLSLAIDMLVSDAAQVASGDKICVISGSARSILAGERVALNFLQRLSGIATLTNRLVNAVENIAVRIVDTRKTTPGLRMLEKYAVRVGGGHNHRMGLYDAVIIKDNHIVAAGGISLAVQRARTALSHTVTITVECESLQQVDEALAAGADVVLLDNMNAATMRKSVLQCKGAAITEASGGINETNVREVALTGVNIISIGALTHSAAPLDISLDLFLG